MGAGRRLGIAGLVVAAVFLAWLAGLVWFARSIPETVEDASSETDAIVVLTGGSQRIETGLKLLAAGKAKKLFVSGVHRGVDVAELLRAHQAPEGLQCCVALGHEAENTLGNAVETAAWMRAEGYTSLRLVTAAYHMPRSRLEFARALPGIRIVPNPIFPEPPKRDGWLAWRAGMIFVVVEYEKYLYALVRPGLPGGSAASEIPR